MEVQNIGQTDRHKIGTMQPEADSAKVCQIDWKTQHLQSPRKPPPIEPPSVIDTIFHRRYVTRSRHYFCSGHEHLGSPRNVNDGQPPFILPPNNKLYARSEPRQRRTPERRRKSERKITDNHHASRSSDILRRLHVETDEPVKCSDKAVGITDIDPNYFKELNSRVMERFSMRDLVNDTREILRTKILINFKKQECYEIDRLIAENEKRLKKTERDTQQMKVEFDTFLAEDHEETIRAQSELERVTKETKAVEEQLDRLTEESEKLQREIYSFKKPWQLQKLCRQFLYKVSPESWRLEHDQNDQFEDWGETTAVSSLDVSHVSDESSVGSLMEITEKALAKSPSLYFKKSSDLIRTFNAIGMQKLNALNQQDQLSEMIEQMVHLLERTQTDVDIEIENIEREIKQLQVAASLMTKKADDLEEYANGALREVFDNLVNSKSILELQVCLEDAYKECVGSMDVELSNLNMIKAIEQTYENLNMQLDKFPKEIVLLCEREYDLRLKKKLRTDMEAEKEAKRMNRLMTVLKRIMEPPKKPKRQLMWRSAPPAPKVKKVRPPPPLTDEEILYLDLFTECSKYDVDVRHRPLVPTALIQQMKEKAARDRKKDQATEAEVLF